MAAEVDIDTFAGSPERSRELMIQIRRQLTLQPQVPSKPGHSGPSFEAAPPPVLFYIWDPASRRIRLPFRYAVGLLGRFPNDAVDFPKPSLRFTGQLYPFQEPVEAEAWDQLRRTGATTIGVYPGFGKTIVAASLACRVGLNVCVLVHREFLLDQWKATFESVTNASVWTIGRGRAPPEPNVMVCMDQRWSQMTPEFRARVGLLVIDEAHTFCTASRVEALLAFTPKYVIAETATLERPDGMHSMIQAVCGSHGIFKISTKPFHVIKLCTGLKPERRLNSQGKIDWAHLESSILQRPERDELIYRLVEANSSFKILILTRRVAHATKMCRDLKERNIQADVMAGAKKKYKDSRVLVGTLSKIGTGFDEASACADFGGERINLALLVCSIKNTALLEQSVGRAFRAAFPTIIHFVDKDPIFSSHWSRARGWYLSRQGTIVSQAVDIEGLTLPKEAAGEAETAAEEAQLGAEETRPEEPDGSDGSE